MNSKDSSIFQVLNLSEYQQNLYSVKSSYTDEQLEFYKMQAKIVSANYFYCFNSIIENQPIPYIYVYDQRSSYKERFFVKFGGNLFFISMVFLFFFLNPIKSCRYVCFLVTLKTPHH